MKRSANILGLPVISITECKELGTSKGLVIDAAKGIACGLLIEDEEWFRGAKILPFKSITAIGEDAITIATGNDILALSDAMEYEPLLKENIKIIHTKVITKSGCNFGIVTEILIDDTGKIVECEITTNDQQIVALPANQISTFGKNVMIIEKISDLKLQESSVPSYAHTGRVIKSADPKTDTRTATSASKIHLPDLSRFSDEEKRRFLLGKKARRTLRTDNGILIVEQGNDITQEVLQKATLAKKFPDLIACIQ